MKIKPSVNNNVNAAIENCRKVIVNETIGLLKQLGAETGQDVLFKKTLILFQTKPNGTSETILCDRVTYEDRTASPLLLVSMGAETYTPYSSSHYMSLSNLEAIYNEVRRVVREE